MRESAETKGVRYLGEGRLTILRVDDRRVEALCFGDSGEAYRVGYKPGGWWCGCPALGRCSHLVALMRVTLTPASRVVLSPTLMVGGSA
jgi:uncharacterized Zn finger protein